MHEHEHILLTHKICSL